MSERFGDRVDRWRAPTDAWLFAAEPAGRMRTMRALLAVLIGARIALSPFRGLADQPAALFRPVWFLRWLDHMPSVEVIVAAQAVGVAAAVLAVVGWRERWTFAVAWASLLGLAGLRASRGKVQHNDVLLLLVAAVVVFAPVGIRWRDRHAVSGWPLRASLVVVAGAYVLSGFQKVVASGPAWVFSDNLRNVMYAAAGTDKAPTDRIALYVADRPGLVHAVALATLAIELGFVAILVWPRVRPWFVVASLVLHTGVYLTHGLDYWLWVATTAVVLVDWGAPARDDRRDAPRAPGRTDRAHHVGPTREAERPRPGDPGGTGRGRRLARR